MRRVLALPFALGLALALGGCMSTVHLPSFNLSSKPVAPAAPVANTCPGSLSADLAPMPPVPDGASVPAAQTPEASAGFALYLQWLHSLADWGRQGWSRAADAKAACSVGAPK